MLYDKSVVGSVSVELYLFGATIIEPTDTCCDHRVWGQCGGSGTRGHSSLAGRAGTVAKSTPKCFII